MIPSGCHVPAISPCKIVPSADLPSIVDEQNKHRVQNSPSECTLLGSQAPPAEVYCFCRTTRLQVSEAFMGGCTWCSCSLNASKSEDKKSTVAKRMQAMSSNFVTSKRRKEFKKGHRCITERHGTTAARQPIVAHPSSIYKADFAQLACIYKLPQDTISHKFPDKRHLSLHASALKHHNGHP